jgi:gliding motility-associated-like protein
MHFSRNRHNRILSSITFYKCTHILQVFLLFLITFSSFSADVAFNKVFKGTGTYQVESNNITVTSEFGFTGYRFTSAIAGATQFSGNNVNGYLTYDSSGVSKTRYGTISRLVKTGSNVTAFYFIQTNSAYTQTNSSLHSAFIFVDPADETDSDYTSSSSRTLGTSSDPVDSALNSFDATQPVVPILTISSDLTTFSSCVNTVSSSQTVSLNGSILTTDVIVTPGPSYEVSLDNTSFSSSVTIPLTSGSVNDVLVYIRMKALATSPASETLTASSTGVTGQTVTLTGAVSPVSVAGTISATSTTLCYNESTTLTLSGSTGSIQWQSSLDGSSWTSISGATSTTLNTGNLTTSTRYRAVVTSGACSSATSLDQTITVNPEISISGTTSISLDLTSQLTGTGTPATSNPWVSSDLTVATISSTGLVSPLKDGTTSITYTQINGCIKTILFTVSTTDTDGDGVSDNQEIADGTDPNDGCSFKLASRILTPSVAWKAADCDGDGTPNGTDSAPLDFCVGGVRGAVPAITTPQYKFFASADCDSDGIGNAMECFGGGPTCQDFDFDGIPNYLDTDSDNDGLLDSYERNIDSDKDGDADYLDLDSDNDGILDRTEGSKDADGDGKPNYLDLDSDGDGILDAWEASEVYGFHSDYGFTGTVKNADGGFPDANGNGLADFLESSMGGKPRGPQDTDKDGIPDFLDLDSDGDSIPDAVELTSDMDKDNRPNYRDVDSDGDLISDNKETSADADGDGSANYLDLDSDADGIPDRVEGVVICESCASRDDQPDGMDDRSNGIAVDTDNDGKPDYLDTDSDNDGIPDSVEAGKDPSNPVDTDGDGTPDFRDTDSDNDGIPDSVEAGKDPSKPVDTDGDGKPDYLDTDSDNDGIPDSVEAGKDPNKPVDTDGDGKPDYQDTDSDNDGIPDSVEAGKDPNKPVDTDGDGKPDYQDTDSDNDGIPDSVEAGKDPSKPVDTDGDGKPDYQDTDSDNDGIPDSVEAGKDPSKPVDTDGDGKPDYQDTDSDNDGIPDSVEAGKDPNKPVDTDGDGKPDYQDTDSDNDGIPDAVEAGKDPSKPVDTDSDGKPDYLDTDSDNDGIPDSVEAGKDPQVPVDTDQDGIPDYRDLDSDGDGIPDKIEAGKDPSKPVDTDGDGKPDYQDLDSDGDGIPDKLEAGSDSTKPVDTDGDGTPDYRDLDSDADGFSDKEEAGKDSSNPMDLDKDGKPDFQDIDSDGDGVLDRLEDDVNFGAIPDCDRDGIPNRIDQDVCQTFLTQGFSPNGDGVNDTFVIPGLLGMGKNKLSIFNRWGNIVYETEDYKNDWGGKATNVFDPLASDGLLPDGVYYYVIDFNGSRPAISNYLFINRLAK